MPEGPGQIFEIASAHNKFSLGSFGASLSDSTFWIVLIYGLFINLQNFGIDQGFVQRYMTTRTEKEAKFSTWLGSLLYLPVSLVFFFIGTALFAYYQAMPGKLPADLQASAMADRVFPYFIVSELPAGLIGLLIASIFAAGMSTISTSLNSSATIILTDYYKRFFQKDASEKSSMVVLYVTTAIMGVFGIIAALAMTQVTSALDAWWALASIFSGGMLGLFLLGYFSRRARNVDAAIAVVIGILLICWISLSPVYFTEGAWVTFKSPLHANLAIVVGTTAIFVVGFFLGTFVNKKKKAIQKNEIEKV